jgi:hypothetical protein
MRDAWAVCLLAALVLLAGCGSGADSDPPATTSLTPAPVIDITTANTATPTAERIAPGLTTRRILDPSTLARTHATTLRNGSVWFVYNRTVVTSDGEFVEQRLVDGRASPNATIYEVTVTLRGPRGGSERAVYRRTANETTPRNRTLPVDPYYETRLEQVLSGLASPDTTRPPMNVTGSSATAFRMTGQRFAADSELSGENVVFEADVLPRGIIMSYRLRYDVVRDGTRVTVHESLVYETVVFDGER